MKKPLAARVAVLVAVAAIMGSQLIPASLAGSTGRQGTVIAAGDIADCSATSSKDRSERVAATGRLVEKMIERRPDAVVAALGDNAYRKGRIEEYRTCYDKYWGAFKDRTRPTPGNHEYDYVAPNDAAGYFEYFGEAAGKPGEGWYSYDIGSWHVIVLNTNGRAKDGVDCRWVSCGEDSAQLAWLQADLAENAGAACTLAYYHHPRFSSGSHGDQIQIQPIWEMLASNGVDVVLNGHEHHYERWQPRDENGDIDPAGMREFIVGTGGGSLYEVNDTGRSEEVKQDVWGVLRLDLMSNRYAWRFEATPNSPDGPYVDRGFARCN